MRRAVRSRAAGFLAVLAFAIAAIALPRAQAPAPAPPPGPAPLTGVDLVRANYTKYEYRIPMRDGARLFTAVYVPKDAAQRYPILLMRTPYSVAPYGVDQYPASLGPSEHFEKEGFIFVYQDVRGRYMSEGEFQQVRPFHPAKGPKDVDESTDTYDTIDWLLKNVAESQRQGRHDRHLVPRLPRGGGHHRRASRPQGGVAAGPDRRLLHGRRRLPQRRLHAGANFGFYSAFVARGPEPERPQAGAPLRSRHAGRVRLLPAHARAAGPDERRPCSAARRRSGRRSSTTRPTTSSGRSDRCGSS